jgi:predicted nucleic acid-binding protein
MQPVLLDTGVIFALLDRREWAHEECVRVLEGLHRPLATCEAVIAESCYLLRHRRDAMETVLSNVENGLFTIPFQLSRSTPQIQAILQKYRDTPADFADACLIAMADELDTGDILTLDSDFVHYRWRKTRPFRMLIPSE